MTEKDTQQQADGLAAELAEIAALLEKDPGAAQVRAREILERAPGQPQALMLLTSAARAAGEEDAARDLLKMLAAAEPNVAAVQYELGLLLAQMEDREGAIVALSCVVELEPRHPDAWRALGDVLAKAGKAAAASKAYAAHLRLRLPAFQRLENATSSDNRFEAAEAMLREHLGIHLTDVVALWMLAGIYIRQERYEQAESLLKRALELSPGFAGARYMYANLLFQNAMYKEALAQLEPLLQQSPEDSDYLRLKATSLLMNGEYDESIALYETLTAKEPARASRWVDYGFALKTVGRQKDAIAAYKQATALQPESGQAWWSLAALRAFRFSPEDIEILRRQLERNDLRSVDRIRIHHALGKALEDEGKYADSFRQYAQGNALRHKALPYGAAASDSLRRMKAVLQPELFRTRSGAGCQTREPIFVLGLTRAGSTLIEQILASHSMVEGTKELQIVNSLLRGLNDHQASAAPPYPEILASIEPDRLKQLGAEYLTQAQIHRKLQRPFFVDKTPDNFQYVGFIHLILPNAKIIDARRHPLGCGFANFRQYYAHGQAFASDLSDIGLFYRNYVELMAHIDALLPGRVYRIFYEDLVTDTEAQVRRLLEHCGLPFEDACLRFHETERAVLTPSSEQVRRPIFKEGMEQWRHYEPWLGPLKAALGDVLDCYPAVPDFTKRPPTPGMQWGAPGAYRWITPQRPTGR